MALFWPFFAYNRPLDIIFKTVIISISFKGPLKRPE